MRGFWRFFSFTLLLTLACQTATGAVEPTAVGEETPAGNGMGDPLVTGESITAVATADFFESNGPVGFSRSRPLPPGEVATGQNWEAAVLEVVRGEPAWQLLHAANQFNEAAPNGQDYLLVRLRLKITGDSSEPYYIYPAVTGDRFILYQRVAAVTPEPRMPSELLAGQTVEAWLPYLIGRGEGNLMLAVKELINYEEEERFIALEEGASVSVPAELAGLPASVVGREADDAVAAGQTATAEDWQLTVLDVEVGDKAWQMVVEANQFNDPPPDGRHYIAVRLHLRYIGLEEQAQLVYGSWFQGRSGSTSYETPSLVDPEPALDGMYLYPGGEVEGWVVVVTADKPGESLTLVFDPDTLSDTNRRYLALPVSGR